MYGSTDDGRIDRLIPVLCGAQAAAQLLDLCERFVRRQAVGVHVEAAVQVEQTQAMLGWYRYFGRRLPK